MAFQMTSAQSMIQSALRTVKDQRSKRKNYRYYRGHEQINLFMQKDRLEITAVIAHDAHAVSVLHGRHILLSSHMHSTFEPDSDKDEARFLTAGVLDLSDLIQKWNEYRTAGDSEDLTESIAPADDQSEEEVNQVSTDDVTGLASGTVRIAFTFRTAFDELPLGIAWLQLEDGGQLLRRREIKELIDAGELQPDVSVVAHRIAGRFHETVLEGNLFFEEDDSSAGVYVNKKAEIAIGINRPVKYKYRIRTDETQVSSGILKLGGILETQTDRLISATIQVVGRRSRTEFESPVRFSFDVATAKRRFGRAIYSWQATMDFTKFDWSEIDSSDNYDLYLNVHSGNQPEPRKLRISRTPFLVRSTVSSDAVASGGKTLAISPYFTFKAKATSLLLEVFDSQAFNVLTEAKHRTFPIKSESAKPVWIVGELPYKAQDNGLHLFRYLREHRPDIDAYYVIDENAPDRRNLVGMDNVVFHSSKEHFELAIRAERFIGTHHAEYLYPTRHQAFSSKTKATRVFLQHGVMGTKWMVPNYGKHAPGFSTDLFMVSSDREKQYIVGDFQYEPSEVKVTGLPRFDSLLAEDTQVNKNSILVIPTWRDWLQTEEAFLESEYLNQWSELLNSPELEKLVKRHGLEITFCLHPNMMQFRDYFASAPVRLIVQGEVDVQELIKKSAVMITDYSSVNFDFSFLYKPVHYFQFDRERFLGRNGSHLNLDKELPGKIAFDRSSLLTDLSNTVERGMLMEPLYQRRANRFITYRDLHSSQRVTHEIEKASLRTSSVHGWRAELPIKLKSRFRKNKNYFKIMRNLFKLYKLLPVDEEMIVFESGLGKQYADSPRYIYEELLRQGDSRQKIWVYSGTHRFADPNTRAVKRFSLEYFWYLARAKYWINNQSFPHYLHRRKHGVFLQTWHGTPLKQMALDITEVHGRDDGYLERVTTATKQWTHLISPSEYTSKIMRSAYAFGGEAVELGYPRNDILIGTEASQRETEVRESLGLPEGCKTVLYAPTFRDDSGTGRGKFTFELPMSLEAFDSRFGQDTVLMLRMHVLISNAVKIPEELSNRIIDVSSYPDIQELYLASDVVITDYSSVFFDYSLLRRPIIFYAYDLENYRDNLRGFYLDYASALPGPIVETEEQLWNCLERALAGEEIGGTDREEFIARFAPNDDGSAARRVVERFFK